MAIKLASLKQTTATAPPRILIFGPPGIGKAQPLDCEVQTPTGPVEIGSLSIGDTILGSDGLPQTVLGVFPQGEADAFKITFRDGSSTRANADHLWRVNSRKVSNVIMTTAEIEEFLKVHESYSLRIPCNPVCEMAAQEVPVDPYVLGFYLADGCGTQATVQLTVAHQDGDIAELVRTRLPDGYAMTSREAPGCTQNGIVSLTGEKGSGFIQIIKGLGLGVKSQVKFIPEIYLNNSVQVRMALLRGLMDGDGSSKNGRTSFSTGSRKLATDFRRLVQTLGGKVVTKEYRRDGRNPELVLNVRTEFNPFECARKASEWIKPVVNGLYRSIDKIEFVGRCEQVCIRVSNSDSLYLTDECIVTHNTSLAAEFPDCAFVRVEDGIPAGVNVAAFPVALDFGTVMDQLADLYANPESGVRTVVVDSVTELQKLVFAETCARGDDHGNAKRNIEDFGYGKGYVRAQAVLQEFIDGINMLRNELGITVILIAHSVVTQFNDPESEAYDQWSISLHKQLVGQVEREMDAILLVKTPIEVKTEDRGLKGTRAIASSKRIRKIYTEGSPAFIAKNRYGLPPELRYDIGKGYAALAPYLPTHAAPSAEQKEAA